MFLSGVLSSTARVLRVNPLLSLRRQINIFSRDDKSPIGPVLAFSVAGQSLLVDGLHWTNILKKIMHNLKLRKCEASEVFRKT